MVCSKWGLLKKKKKKNNKVEIDAKFLTKCACTMYGPVYYTLNSSFNTNH